MRKQSHCTGLPSPALPSFLASWLFSSQRTFSLSDSTSGPEKRKETLFVPAEERFLYRFDGFVFLKFRERHGRSYSLRNERKTPSKEGTARMKEEMKKGRSKGDFALSNI